MALAGSGKEWVWRGVLEHRNVRANAACFWRHGVEAPLESRGHGRTSVGEGISKVISDLTCGRNPCREDRVHKLGSEVACWAKDQGTDWS